MGKPVMSVDGFPYRDGGDLFLDTNGSDCCCASETCPDSCGSCPSTVDIQIIASIPITGCSSNISLSVDLGTWTRSGSTCLYSNVSLLWNPVCSQTPNWTGSASSCTESAAQPMACPDTPGNINITETIVDVFELGPFSCIDDFGNEVWDITIGYETGGRSYCEDETPGSYTCSYLGGANTHTLQFQKAASTCPTGVWSLVASDVAGVAATLVVT